MTDYLLHIPQHQVTGCKVSVELCQVFVTNGIWRVEAKGKVVPLYSIQTAFVLKRKSIKRDASSDLQY